MTAPAARRMLQRAEARVARDAMNVDQALKMIAIVAGAAAIAVEILDRLAARSFPKAENRRTSALTLWMVAGMLAAAAFL